MINIEFLILTLIISKSVDWILQTKHHATHKTIELWPLLEHSFIYAAWTASLVYMIIGHYSLSEFVFVAMALFYSHLLIDNRWVVKQIMIIKGMTTEEVYSKEYAWLERGIDQRLHELVILGLSMIV